MRALGDLLVRTHQAEFGGEAGYQPLLIEVAVIYESVSTDMLVKRGDVEVLVRDMGMLREAKRVRDEGVRTGPAADKVKVECAGAGPDKTAVVMLDPTRYARSGPFMAAAAAQADKEGIALYTTFVDANGVDLINRGVVVPAGVTGREGANFFRKLAHISTWPALRRFFLLPGGGAALTFTCIASGDAANPAPAGNLAWAMFMAVQGCLVVLALNRSFTFWSRSSAPLVDGRHIRTRRFRAATTALSPPLTIHTKIYNNGIRLRVVRALHNLAFEGAHRIHGGTLRHLGGSPEAATVAAFRGDNAARTRAMTLGFLADLPGKHPEFKNHMVPTVDAFSSAVPLEVRAEAAMGDLVVDYLQVGDVIEARIFPEGDDAPTHHLLGKVADVNSSWPLTRDFRGADEAVNWREDVYLRQRDIRVGLVTWRVDLVLRPELRLGPDPLDHTNTRPRVAFRQVVRVRAGGAENDVLFPPRHRPPLELKVLPSVIFRHRSGGEDAPDNVAALAMAMAAYLRPGVAEEDEDEYMVALRGGDDDDRADFFAGRLARDPDSGYGGGNRPRYRPSEQAGE